MTKKNMELFQKSLGMFYGGLNKNDEK
jgi:hypothetical protein